MNQYIQKYGQNAIQAYKKSLRLSQSLQKDVPSPVKQQSHLLPKRSLSKKSLKPKKNQSQTKLAHSKSIKNVSKVQDDQRKKGSSFIDGSKKVVITNTLNGFGHTFSKLSSNPLLNQQKKKLIITQSNTPKCSTPKMHINLNIHQNKHMQHQKPYTSSIPYEQKDKLTERIQRSSGKKNMDKCSTSQSKHQTKRSFLKGIESRLQDLLISTQSTMKSLSYGIRQCFDILLMNEDDLKLRKLFMLLKELFEKVSGLGQKYKLKFKKANQKIHSMQMIHQAYLVNSETSQTRAKSKLEGDSINSKVTKKQASIQAIIMNENYELRKKLNKLEKELEYYTSQSASLNNVFGKFKNSQSQLNISKGFNSHLQEDHHSSAQKNQVFSNRKLQKRRSSQNLLYKNQGNDNGFALGVEKRLSFDPGLLQGASETKKKLLAQQQFNSLYNSSMGSSEYSQPFYNEAVDYDSRRPHRQNRVEQLSEQEDSQNQE